MLPCPCAHADLGPMLLGLLPVLVARMGQLPVQEPAEEVRLAAQELLQAVVKAADARWGRDLPGADTAADARPAFLGRSRCSC